MPAPGPEEFDDLSTPPAFFPYEDEEPEAVEPTCFGEPVQVGVGGVFVLQSGGSIQRFVLLVDGARRLPIMIGEAEAYAIEIPLEGKRAGRPMTHDLLASILERLGAEVDRIFIDDLVGGTFYAKMFLIRGDEEIEIDSRPSDAIAIAVRVGAPIYVAEGILAQAVD